MSSNLPVVLVVDDNEMNRDMLARRLQRQNCEVLMAENGAVALDMVKKRVIDLILLDIMMPNISGYEVLERLKADDVTRAIPVIMISAVDDLESVVKCIEMGAEDYLFKPFNPVLLKARVGASLSKRQAELASSVDMNALKQAVDSLKSDIKTLAMRSISGDDQPYLDQVQTSLDVVVSLLK